MNLLRHVLGGRGCKIADIAEAPEITEGDVVGLLIRRDQVIDGVKISVCVLTLRLLSVIVQ